MLVALARVVLSSGKPKVPFTQKMSLNFVTRKLKTQKLEENNENEESSVAALNETEVRVVICQFTGVMPGFLIYLVGPKPFLVN